MRTKINAQTKVAELYTMLCNHGVVLLPTNLGYALVAVTARGVNHLYNLKGRPKNKPSGVLATTEIFASVTTSDYVYEVDQIDRPLGVIEHWNPASAHVANLPRIGKAGHSIALFLNLDGFMKELAEHAYENGRLIMVTSANLAGTGNNYRLQDVPQSIREGCVYEIDGGTSEYQLTRSAFETITTTMIDLTNKEFVRPGAFVFDLIEECAELGLIGRKQVREFKRERGVVHYRSAMFIRSFSESSWRKLDQLYDADWLILDTEDGCPPEQKPIARKLIEKNMQAGVMRNNHFAFRINALTNNEDLQLDLSIKYNDSLDAFMLPMLSKAEDVVQYERLISNMEAKQRIPAGHFKLIPLIETPDALHNVEAIARASNRNIAMTLGHADLFSEVQCARTYDNLLWPRMKFLAAAKQANLMAWDTPYESIHDIKGYREECQQGRSMGMDGKITLHPFQLDIANQVFGITAKQRRELTSQIEEFTGGCYMDGQKFVGAPIVKRLETEVKRGVYIPRSNANSGARPISPRYGAEPKELQVGRKFRSNLEITVDKSWTTAWQSLVPTFNPIETSVEYCRAVGLKDQLVPYHLLINLSLCLLVEPFSESCRYHLGVSRVRYEKAVYAGDTLRAEALITGVTNSSGGTSSVVHTRVRLFNQWDECVLSMNRKSLFHGKLIEGEAEHLPASPDDEFRRRLFQRCANARLPGRQLKFESGQVIAHSLVRTIGLSASVSNSLLFKNTHPLHIDTSQYDPKDLAVNGGFVLPMVIGAAMRDLKYAVHEQVGQAQHVNTLNQDDAVGAFTWVQDVQNEGSLECLKLRSFGLRNVNMNRSFENARIPLELLECAGLRPKEIERLCHEYMPDLAGNIVLVVDWEMWRVRDQF